MIAVKYFEINRDAQKSLLLSYTYDSAIPPEPINSSYNKFRDEGYKSSPINYIALDGIGINLDDDTSLFAEDTDYIGFLGDELTPTQTTSGGGVIIEEYKKGLEFGFIGFPTPYVINGITINYIGSPCDYVSIILLNPLGAVITSTFVKTPKLSNQIDIYGENVGIIQMRFTASRTNQFLKLANVVFGVIDDLNKFKTFEIYKEMDVTSKDLPISSCDFTTVSNENFNFSPYQDIIVYHNQQIYDYFFVENVERNDKTSYYFDAVDGIGVNETQSGIGLIDKQLSEGDYNVSADYEGVTIKGFDGFKTYRFSLMQIAFALGGWVDCNNNDNPIIKPLDEQIKWDITNSEILGNAVLEKQTRPKTVRLHIYEYVQTDELVEVWRDTETPDNYIRTIEFYAESTEPMANYVITGSGHLDHDSPQIEYGSNYIFGTLLECRGDNPTIVSRYKYNKIDNVIEIINSSSNNSNIEEWQDYTISCPEKLELLKTKISTWQKSRGIVKAKVVLYNDIRLGDAVTIQTAYDGTIAGIVTKMTIYPGYNNIADIEVTEWQTVGRG